MIKAKVKCVKWEFPSSRTGPCVNTQDDLRVKPGADQGMEVPFQPPSTECEVVLSGRHLVKQSI